MPGPISQSYDGPDDTPPLLPRWAFPHLTDEQYAALRPSCCMCGGVGYETYEVKGGYVQEACPCRLIDAIPGWMVEPGQQSDHR